MTANVEQPLESKEPAIFAACDGIERGRYSMSLFRITASLMSLLRIIMIPALASCLVLTHSLAKGFWIYFKATS
jgi:hypothetical protein